MCRPLFAVLSKAYVLCNIQYHEASHSCRITCEHSESARERRIALCKSDEVEEEEEEGTTNLCKTHLTRQVGGAAVAVRQGSQQQLAQYANSLSKKAVNTSAFKNRTKSKQPEAKLIASVLRQDSNTQKVAKER